MTNKYQKLFKYKAAQDFISDSQFADYYPRETAVIKEALQAGAEGRILPKLPDGYRFGVSNLNSENNYQFFGEIIAVENIMVYFASNGKTPAEAMQNAIDKIGGQDENK